MHFTQAAAALTAALPTTDFETVAGAVVVALAVMWAIKKPSAHPRLTRFAAQVVIPNILPKHKKDFNASVITLTMLDYFSAPLLLPLPFTGAFLKLFP